jgi:lysophospholipase L1-like esterase
MDAELAKVLGFVLSLIGPPSADAPKSLQLKSGNQIVAIGDSITQAGGYLRDINAVLSTHYAELNLPKVVNVGISGQKAEDLVARFDRDVVARKPAYVTISIGINDVWHRLAKPPDDQILKSYIANVTKMVEKAQAAGINVILISPTIIQENPQSEGNKRLAMYVKAEKEIANEKKCQFVDLHGMFLAALKKKPTTLKGNWLTSDGVHMQARGDAIMAIGVLRALGVPDKTIATP